MSEKAGFGGGGGVLHAQDYQGDYNVLHEGQDKGLSTKGCFKRHIKKYTFK